MKYAHVDATGKVSEQVNQNTPLNIISKTEETTTNDRVSHSNLKDVLPTHHNYAAALDPQSAISKALSLANEYPGPGSGTASNKPSEYLDQLLSTKNSSVPVISKETIDYREVFSTQALPIDANRTMPATVTRTTIDYRNKFNTVKRTQSLDKSKIRDALVSQILGSHEVHEALEKVRSNAPSIISPAVSLTPETTSTSNGHDLCQSKKRIILSVNRCGLGNRMVSLASTVMLALLMDRVIELDWISNRYCEASYKDLFHAKPQSNLPHSFRPFVYDVEESMPLLKRQEELTCQVYFDQTLNYTHLSFLSEKASTAISFQLV